jgi:hypothetical protein
MLHVSDSLINVRQTVRAAEETVERELSAPPQVDQQRDK